MTTATTFDRPPEAAPPLDPAPRLLAAADHAAGRPASREEHLAVFGPLTLGRSRAAGRAILEEVARSGLRGRGGAGFPAAVKLEAVASRRGRKVVVANGTEGEPASVKDATLMAHDPDLVVDGVLAAATAVGACEGVVVVSRGAPRAARRMAAAIDRRSGEAGVRLRLERAPERFVMGEESALVNWLNGGPAVPTAKPPRPFERGVAGRPTLVHNVETLAHLALIARYGGEWFREVGTGAEPGTVLVSVGGGVVRPGVHEVAIGTTIGDVIARAGGAPDGIGGVLVGGYFGAWVAAGDPRVVPMSVAGLREAGASLGAGALVVLPAGACALRETARVMRWLSGESAGQCGPCVFGLRALAEAATALAGGARASEALREMRRLPGEVERRGACAHPDGAARLARSALAAFPDEVRHHLDGCCAGAAHPDVLPIPDAPTEWR